MTFERSSGGRPLAGGMWSGTFGHVALRSLTSVAEGEPSCDGSLRQRLVRDD